MYVSHLLWLPKGFQRSEEQLQIKSIFYYIPNIFSTFFNYTLFFFQIRFLCKHKLTFNPTFRWNEELGIRKDAVERV